MSIQSDIRFSVPPGVFGKLPGSKLLRGMRKVSRTRTRIRKTYYDSPRKVFQKQSVRLFLQQEEERRFVGLKVPASYGEDRERAERYAIVADEPPTTDILQHDMLPKNLSRLGRVARLGPCFEIDCDRTRVEFETGRSRIRLTLDQGVISATSRAGRKDDLIHEARLQLVSGDPVTLRNFALELSEKYALNREHRSKAIRGYELARASAGNSPATASTVDMAEEVTTGEAFTRIVASSLDHLYQNQALTLRGQHEGVHQTRVALRRTRAALRAFKRCLPYDMRKAYNGELRWFQQRFGTSRDWHVFLTETLPDMRKDIPDSAALARLERIAQRERRKATAETIELMHGKRYGRLLLQFERWMTIQDMSDESVLGEPIRPFATTVLMKTHRDLLSETRALGRLSGDDLHEIRKRVKKLRYAMEFFSELWGDALDTTISDLKKLQKSLGEANDARTAIQIFSSLDPARVQTRDIEVLRQWVDSRLRRCTRSAQPVWKRLRQTPLELPQ